MDMTYFGDHGPSARLLGPWTATGNKQWCYISHCIYYANIL